MKHFIINIARDAGCGGKEVGKRLAELLDASYYDREIVEAVSRETGISAYDIAHMEEIFADSLRPDNPDVALCDEIIRTQAAAIKNFAKDGSCVFVGRCADYILRDNGDCLNIYLYAPVRLRAKRFMKHYGLDKTTAELTVKHIDEKRDHYYQYVTGAPRNDTSSRHLMIDTSLFGIEGTAQLLKEIAEMRFYGAQE